MANPAPANRAAVAFIFIAMTLDVIAMGITIPMWPTLIEDFVGKTDPADVVRIGSWLGFVWAFMQFVFTPIQGALSDHYGRRPVLLLSMAGLGLDYILMALAPDLWWIFVGRAISGVTAASFGTANAYIADITPPDKRAAAFGLMGAAFGIGFVLGPLLGGQLGAIDPRLPFWVAAGLCLLNALYGFFILPESLPPERRAKFSLAHANPFGAFKLLLSNAQLAGLSLAQFFYMIAHNVYPAVFTFFTMYRYGWDGVMISYALAAVGLASIVVNGFLIGPIVKQLGERRAIRVGLMFGITAFLIYGFGETGFWVWIAIPIAALWAIYGPAAQTLMTQQVTPSEQGRLQGALGSLMGIAMIIAPILYPQVFALAIDAKKAMPATPFLLGAPFFVAALLLMAALAVAWRVTRPKPVPA